MVAEDRTIVSVTSAVTGGGMDMWTVEFRKPDGSTGCHVFPKTTLLWRSIEYGIDIADVDTLIDVILHEPFIDDPTDPANHADDPAAKLGHVVATPGIRDEIFGAVVRAAAQVPVWLYNAPDVHTARAAHLVRVEHSKSTKARYGRHSGRGADPLDAIRNEHREVIGLIAQVPEVAAVHEGMRAHIRANREQAREATQEPQVMRHAPWDKGNGGKG